MHRPVFATASGKQIGAIIESPTWNGGFIIADFRVLAGAGLLSDTNPGTITIKQPRQHFVVPRDSDPRYS
jgi:hypothetical protein